MQSDFHVAENVFCPEAEGHHWLVENALNAVVCAHSTETEANDCCAVFCQSGQCSHT